MIDPASAWQKYDTAVRRAANGGLRTNLTVQFESDKYHFGQIPPALASSAATAVRNSERHVFECADFTPGFITFEYPLETVTKMNATTIHHKLDARANWALADLLDAIKQEVAACLGSPWRTLNVRAYTTLPLSESFGPYSWHTDGFVDEIFKIMIYLSPLTDETGSVEFDLDGKVLRHRAPEPGAWVLFKNSTLRHRGVPGMSAARLAVEITLSRAARFDVRPRYPGLNAHWPAYPWIEALDGCRGIVAQKIAAEARPFRRRVVRRVFVAAVKAGLYAILPFTPLAIAMSARAAPDVARRFRALQRHSKEKTMHSVADRIWRYVGREGA